MNIPDQLRYTPHHLWVELQPDGSVHAGITDHAQETLGDIVYVDLPAVGSTITMGQPCGLIESVKTATDLHAPLTGTVLKINDELLTSPERINESPYTSWIFSMEAGDAAELTHLINAEAYRRLIEQ